MTPSATALDWIETPPTQSATTMASIRQVDKGLPLTTADKLSNAIAPADKSFKYRFVPKATYLRRLNSAPRNAASLSKEESERVVRISRLWAFAVEVWKDEGGARRFMLEPHMLLDGETPFEVALSGELGGKLVEEILGRLAYGSAA